MRDNGGDDDLLVAGECQVFSEAVGGGRGSGGSAAGAWLEKERLERELAKEYFQNGPPVLEPRRVS